MNRVFLKLKRELIAGLSKIRLKSVRSDYFGMPLVVPIVYGVKNGGYIVPAEAWMGDCLRAFVGSKQGTVLDIGVNVGLYLVKLRHISKDIPYVGFEPSPSCQLYTQELIRLNQFENAKVLPVALSDSYGVQKFYASKVGDESGSLIKERKKGMSLAFSFDALVMRGDDLVKQIGVDEIAAIKIDVEEAEVFVVRGLVETIKKHRPYIYSEILDINTDTDKLDRKNELCDILTGLDYKIFGLSRDQKSMQLIDDVEKIGRDYLQEYIFCPTELQDQFLTEIRKNSSGVKV